MAILQLGRVNRTLTTALAQLWQARRGAGSSLSEGRSRERQHLGPRKGSGPPAASWSKPAPYAASICRPVLTETPAEHQLFNCDEASIQEDGDNRDDNKGSQRAQEDADANEAQNHPEVHRVS